MSSFCTNSFGGIFCDLIKKQVITLLSPTMQFSTPVVALFASLAVAAPTQEAVEAVSGPCPYHDLPFCCGDNFLGLLFTDCQARKGLMNIQLVMEVLC